MTLKNQAALDFLHARRSRPAKTLVSPAPTREELRPLLTAAARSPDHGKLEPWRFVVVEHGAMQRLADLTETCGLALGKSPEDIAKAVRYLACDAPFVTGQVLSVDGGRMLEG